MNSNLSVCCSRVDWLSLSLRRLKYHLLLLPRPLANRSVGLWYLLKKQIRGGFSEMNRTDLASVKNASSTPSLTFADVSMNLMPNSSASARPCSSVTAFLSVQSDLLPMRILLTPSEACCSMLLCQVWISDDMNNAMQVRNTRMERTVEWSLVCYIVY